jgi:hypothetical protein
VAVYVVIVAPLACRARAAVAARVAALLAAAVATHVPPFAAAIAGGASGPPPRLAAIGVLLRRNERRRGGHACQWLLRCPRLLRRRKYILHAGQLPTPAIAMWRAAPVHGSSVGKPCMIMPMYVAVGTGAPSRVCSRHRTLSPGPR